MKLTAYIFYGFAALAFVLGVVMVITLVRALTVDTTLAAVESAFGSFVLVILLFVSARKLFDAARKRMKTEA